MSDITLSRGLDAATGAQESRASLGASLALVVGFWWAATGVTLAMQRSAFTSAAQCHYGHSVCRCGQCIGAEVATPNYGAGGAARVSRQRFDLVVVLDPILRRDRNSHRRQHSDGAQNLRTGVPCDRSHSSSRFGGCVRADQYCGRSVEETESHRVLDVAGVFRNLASGEAQCIHGRS